MKNVLTHLLAIKSPNKTDILLTKNPDNIQHTETAGTSFKRDTLAFVFLCANAPGSNDLSTAILNETYLAETPSKQKGVQVKKKYKPVALCTKPVAAKIPDGFWIIRNIIGDPLEDMPSLSPNPPPYSPTGHFM
ncbi:hypothetical protein C0991_011812 [Blastosporella zonata]|nr:hypothetical protein C0991_011812 [Blastosporella zonata]